MVIKHRPNNDLVIGKIFASWCHHCRELKSEWKKIKNIMKYEMGRSIKNQNINIVEIGDTDKNKKMGKTVDSMIAEFNKTYLTNLAVNGGYPTIFKFCNGKLEYFHGLRTSHEIWKWVKESCSPSKSLSIFGGRSKTQKNRSLKNKKRKTVKWWPFYTLEDLKWDA